MNTGWSSYNEKNEQNKKRNLQPRVSRVNILILHIDRDESQDNSYQL